MSSYVIGGVLARTSRAASLGLVAGVYLVAGGAGALTWWLLAPHHHPLAVALWADLVGTAVVFAASVLARNASLYDPYWSVAPPLVVLGWVVAAGHGVGVRQALVLGLVTVWAVRLTGNWMAGWTGLSHEDWRYVQMREQTRGRLPWWLVNLTGVQLVPTLVVFAGLLAVWPAVTGDRPLGWLDAVAAGLTATAIALEALADRQLHRFTAEPANRGRIADRGVWRYVRHPNYLGEIAFWWGLWLFGLAAAPRWWTVVGPLAMVALFTGVSIPMMDRRSLDRRPGYREHMRKVPALLPRLTRRPAPAP
ncbi:DUF1295 domain-containing protein [Micromonospora sp. NPDC049523]|uniref:DUF1295 domain-containing protein n=1 Tax=Micromonospora sp. NPDC049523 TaxID=3155921 RepID=UPI00341B150A